MHVLIFLAHLACTTDKPSHSAPQDTGGDSAEVWDADGDGYTVDQGDCDDQDWSRYPGASEGGGSSGTTGDGIDNDCDGVVDEGTDLYDDDADGVTEVEGDCDDEDPAIHPGAEEIADNSVDENCDASTLGPALALADADALLTPPHELLFAGKDVALGGDLDGDGYADLAVGALGYDMADGGARVYLQYGPVAGALSLESSDGVLLSEVMDHGLGQSVRFVGDLDGDGFGDAVAGAYSDRPPDGDGPMGAVYVIQGPASGTRSEEDGQIIYGADSSEALGYAVDGAGDVNGDGLADIVAGGLRYNESPGEAVVFHGPLTGFVSSADADHVLLGETVNDHLGARVRGGCDLDGDGRVDLLAAAPDGGQDPPNAGRVYLALSPMGPTENAADADAIFAGTDEEADAGAGLDCSGPSDTTEPARVAIGAPLVADPHPRGGAVWLLEGPFSGTTSLDGSPEPLQADTSQEWLGANLAFLPMAGGAPDLLVGAPRDPYGSSTYPGKVYHLTDLSGGLSAAKLVSVWFGESPEDLAGMSLDAGGDVNGDGHADAIVGAYGNDAAGTGAGRAYVINGGGGW